MSKEITTGIIRTILAQIQGQRLLKKLLLLERIPLMLSACTICTATCGNGAAMNTVSTRACEYFVEAVGTMKPRFAGQPLATHRFPGTGVPGPFMVPLEFAL